MQSSVVTQVGETFFRHLQIMDDTAVGILRCSCDRVWRELRKGLEGQALADVERWDRGKGSCKGDSEEAEIE